MKDITSKKFQCDAGGRCPGVFALEDGQIAVRGKEVSPEGVVGTVEHIVLVDPAMFLASFGEYLKTLG